MRYQDHKLRARAHAIHQPTLTPREEEVLHWLLAGKSNWAISMILGCKENTVKTHVKNIFSKLGVNCRIQAVARCAELGTATHAARYR
jgi:DNA-binding CsgD family transcriptional regulator